MEKLIVLGIAAVMGMSMFSKRPARMGEPLPPLPAPNRALWATVSASSSRLLRLSEVQGGGAMMLYLPQVQAQCKAAYAADGSPLTQWATDENGPQYLQYDFANRLQARAKIGGVVIRWGEDYAREYEIQVSEDGQSWRVVKAISDGKGKIEQLEFEPPVLTRMIRLWLKKSATPKGFAVIDWGVYGPGELFTPPNPDQLLALAHGPNRVKIEWKAKVSELTYHFLVYRDTRPDFEPRPENLIAIEDRFEHTDFGLEPGTTYYYKVLAESFSNGVIDSGPVAKVTTAAGEKFSRVQWRGVIEGFYNDPWPHQERLKLLAFLEDAGFNAYIYAPKVEPYHRQLWREPYPEEEMKNFAELLAAAKAHRITFIYAISPGLDMDYTDPAEIEALKRKLEPFFALGVRAFTIALDDLPDSKRADGEMAAKQAAMVNTILRWLTDMDPATVLFFCPTVYEKSYEYQVEKKPRFAEYSRGLAALDPKVPIFWTGHDVFSETIDLASAQGLSQVYGRKILIWDNYPVNDGGLRRNLFLGPYTGRDLNLGEAVAGIFLNPMYLPNANYVPLYTAGRYFTDPDCEPWAAYEDALRFVAGEEGAPALRLLADALLNHPLYPGRDIAMLPLSRAIEAFWQAGGQGEAGGKLRQLFEAYARHPDELQAKLDNFELVQELLPASEKLALFGRAGLLCLDYLAATDPEQRESWKKEIVALREQSRRNPWHVADGNLHAVYRLLLGAKKKGVVMEQFISRVFRSK